MNEHKKTEDEINHLENIEIPKWEKRRKKAEEAIKAAKAMTSQTGK